MTFPDGVKKCLVSNKVEYESIICPDATTLPELIKKEGLSENLVIRAVLLEDRRGLVLAVLPYSRIIDFSKLEKFLKREFKPAESDTVGRVFSDCDNQTVPPIGKEYGLTAIVDSSVFDMRNIYFEPGIRGQLVGVSSKSYKKIQKKAKVFDFSTTVKGLDRNSIQPDNECCKEAGCQHGSDKHGSDKQGSDKHSVDSCDCVKEQEAEMFEKYMPSPDVKKRLDQLYSLPPMPQVAVRILQIKDDPDSSVDDLAACVELDPSLAAQVVRYARSPFFGYRGEINTIRDAIHKVLGFNMVTNIAVGLASGKSFKNPPDGPLGLNIFWKQATYSAAIVQELARALPKDKRPNLGVAYLSALLHNFGFLLLGHMFKPEFFLLNKLVSANLDAPVTGLEKQVLGMGDAQHVISMGHARLGAWLMYTWKMPDEVVVTLAEHHNEDYVGVHSIYPNLVLITDRLIKSIGFGDGCSAELPQGVIDRLGISESRVLEVFERVMDGSDSLDNIANQLVA